MKRIIILAAVMFLIPAAAFTMHPLTEAEMDSISASSGVPVAIDDEKIDPQAENSAPLHQASEISGSSSEAKNNVSRFGSGVAIFIDDVKIYHSESSEIWYKNAGAAIGVIINTSN